MADWISPSRAGSWLNRLKAAGVYDAIVTTGACPCTPTGQHDWLPWWVPASGLVAITKCARCGRQESVSVLPQAPEGKP